MYDFFSDTKTKPSMEMRKTVLNCPVGDEQKSEDPTTTELCEKTAQLLGKESAVFLPSGTMCNEIAIKIHTQPGEEIICEYSSHIINFETGGPSALSGVMIRALHGSHGIFESSQVAEAIRPSSRYAPKSSLLCVEQTANMSGGTIWPLDKMQAVTTTAHQSGLKTHMDGARLMNAVVKTGISAEQYGNCFDSVWIDFTKGLGAPIGAVLAGSKDFIDHAWRIKQQWGGAMRQSGIAAAMCMYALDNNIDRLADDHHLADIIGQKIIKFKGVKTVLPIETNIIIFDLEPSAPTANELVKTLAKKKILIGAFGERRIRIVTHLDVDPSASKILIEELAKHLDY
ncbi:MAG: threonine aldolase family protein [Alphaproteobacteria bacterium]|nr:threonine aldolase family protein [Alphaproteobacteria bacterium]